LLEKALALRRKIAGLLGYQTWADYITEEKMVKSGKNVKDVRYSSLACDVAHDEIYCVIA
jgi:Zn-dependent oligopeptidase